MYNRAIKYVADELGSFEKMPRAVFYSTETCFQEFWFNKASASNVGKWGLLLALEVGSFITFVMK